MKNHQIMSVQAERYRATVEQLRQQREAEEQARLAKQREEEAKGLAKQRRAEAIEKSKVETQTFGTFELKYTGLAENAAYEKTLPAGYKVWGSITLTDVSIKYHQLQSNGYTQNYSRNFCQVREISGVGEAASGNQFVIAMGHEYRRYDNIIHEILRFNSQAEARAAHDAVASAFETWKKKFPEAVKGVNP